MSRGPHDVTVLPVLSTRSPSSRLNIVFFAASAYNELVTDVLLQTKFFKPSLRPSLIARPQLIAQLNAALGSGTQGFTAKLTLVSAPAGFGKTTLVSAWLAQLAAFDQRYSSDKSVAWLSLDENDNDPVRFLNYLIAALQVVALDIGQTAVQYLQSPQPPAAETILTLLVNDLSHKEGSIILVLDDYHVITTPAVHQALMFLLDHLPPQSYLVIASRSDPPLPLSRLRARNQLIEIRPNDLRFSPDEARLFFEQVMGLYLSQEELAALEQRTEGWIAGLQLAALSLRGRDDQNELIAAFAGSHRFIVDYLTEEVLNHQSSSVREFLLYTSILKQVCGPLADALTLTTCGQATLEDLEHNNLFLIPLDDQRGWYRYHQLFAGVLRQYLQHQQPAIVPELHNRAREWLAKNGLVHEAVNHALAGRQFEQAAYLIESVHGVMWQRGEIKTVQDWLVALPKESWSTHSRLWLVQAWADMTVGDFSEADEKLRGAEQSLALLDERERGRLRPEVRAFRASYASLVQDPRAVELAQQALEDLPSDYWLRGMLVVFLGAAYYSMGLLDTALDALAQAPGSAQASLAGQPHAIHLLAFGGMVQLAKGRLRDAVETVGRALTLAEPGGKPILYVGTLMAYMAASLIYYEENALKQVETYLKRCLAQATSFGSSEVQVFALSGLVRLCLARDDLVGAEDYSNQVDAQLKEHVFTSSIMAYIDYHRFRLLLKQGNLAGSEDWLDSYTSQSAPLNPYALHRIALPQLLLAQGEAEQALRELVELIQESQEAGHGSLLIKATILQAMAYRACGNERLAFKSLERAVSLAEPEGFIRAFADEGGPMQALLYDYRSQLATKLSATTSTGADQLLVYTNKLLATFSQPVAPAPRPLDPYMDPLSDRELEVLRLIASGASNREIADALVIAVPTAKKHVSNILSKLNATSRTQAVAEARALGLL